ncbi:cell envelope biogenesis protein OmpA [Cellulophaga sp. L1A9]|uniref:TolB family protein n=1 Tax=Cellulophaga sp. L1A9 TaxID=2686362 RepID=UPI001E2FD919|nr:cell envelope biogenesis protein OmpA [Cellulophaga sp. L1A9]
MKNNLTYNVFFATMIAFSCYSTQAQDSDRMSKSEKIENTKRNENFKTLKNLGYSEKEIYEDLGNANFLSENYETALHWYTKLFKLSDGAGVRDSYVERYQYAMQKTGNEKATKFSKDRNWVASVKSDYKAESKETKFNDFYINPTASKKSIEEFVARETRQAITSENQVNSRKEELQIAITPDGTAAYFTKAIYVKPEYGVFSKKELVHKIFKAEKVSGQWKTVEEVALGPKNSSSMHPAISEDGKRLFFASDMPGTFGKFDIYVADLKSNGKFGAVKNLGKKVNTDENDLYPNIVGGTSLFFASNGHKGYGGLDVFMVEVANNRVGASVNLGSPINSSKDEFSLDIMNKNGTGYVLINRVEDKGAVERVAFSYSKSSNSFTPETKDDGILEAMNTESKINYATSIFEDK